MDEWITLEEFARTARLHLDTARRYAREGKLEARKIGKRYLMKAADAEAFMETRAVTHTWRELDSRTGYEKEITERIKADGTTSKAIKLLTASEERLRECVRLLKTGQYQFGDGSVWDFQALNLEAARNLARDGSTKGRKEASLAFLSEVNKILASQAEMKGKSYSPISEDPPAHRIEGMADAEIMPRPDEQGRRTFDGIKARITDSVRRVGRHEPDGGKDRKGWSRLAKRKARDAKKDADKHRGEMPATDAEQDARRAAASDSSDVPMLDLDGFAAEVGLTPDLREFWRIRATGAKLSEFPALLMKATGQKWDAARVHRVRMQFYRLLKKNRGQIVDALKHHLSTGVYRNGQTIVELKKKGNPKGSWVHIGALKLFGLGL